MHNSATAESKSASPPSSATRLDVIGVGIKLGGHLTLDAVSVLRKADRVITVMDEPVNVWFPTAYAGASFEVHSLADCFHRDRRRMENYAEAAAEVIRLSLRGGRTVFACHGSALVYNSVTMLVRKKAQEARLPFKIHCGISCIEAILSFLDLDAAPAFTVLAAQWMFQNRAVPDAAYPLLIVQVAGFTTDRIPDLSRLDGHSLTGLREFLCEFYPTKHPVVFVRAPESELDPGYRRECALEHMCDGPTEDLAGTCIYLRAV